MNQNFFALGFRAGLENVADQKYDINYVFSVDIQIDGTESPHPIMRQTRFISRAASFWSLETDQP